MATAYAGERTRCDVDPRANEHCCMITRAIILPLAPQSTSCMFEHPCMIYDTQPFPQNQKVKTDFPSSWTIFFIYWIDNAGSCALVVLGFVVTLVFAHTLHVTHGPTFADRLLNVSLSLKTITHVYPGCNPRIKDQTVNDLK